MAGFEIFTLKADAISIRDTTVQRSNSTEIVGGWCRECCRYLNNDGDLLDLANQITNETAISGNTANRMGSWCKMALDFVGRLSHSVELYNDLTIRAGQIYDEYRDGENVRRLGAWFVDFLTYIDYSGDTDTSVFWILTYETTTPNETVYLPISSGTSQSLAYSFQVDWGDGGEVETITNSEGGIQPTNGWEHTYTNPGTYQLYIYGADADNITNFVYRRTFPDYNKHLVRIDQLGTSLQNLSVLSFSECRNLSEIVDQGNYENTLPNIENLSYLFNSCPITSIPSNFFKGIGNKGILLSHAFDSTAITTIPVELFDPFISLRSIDYLFYNSSINYLPELFRNVPVTDQVSSIAHLCRYCNNLVTIDPNAFKTLANITTAYYSFMGCTRLTMIPESLFVNNSNITNFEGVFWQCSGLTGVPENIFTSCNLATNFTRSFMECSSLTSISENIFQNNINASLFTGTFQQCNNLRSIGAGLFRNCTRATQFDNTFYSTAISEIPLGIFRYNINANNFNSTFYNCVNLTSIPQGLFTYCTRATNFSGTFYNCIGITTIPDGLFNNNVNATNFTETFAQCRSLSDITTGLFTNTNNAQNFTGTFRNCSSLIRIPSYTFLHCSKATTFYRTFYQCSALEVIGDQLFVDCTSAQNFSETFYDCSRLRYMPENLFVNCNNVTTYQNCFRGAGDISTTIGVFPTVMFGQNSRLTNITNMFTQFSMPYNISANFFTPLAGSTGITSLYSLFNNSALQSIDGTAFSGLENITNISLLFTNTRISEIPAGLFTPFASKIINLSSFIANCYSLININYCFDGMTSLRNMNGALSGTRQNIVLPSDLFRDLSAVTSLQSLFNNSTGVNIPEGLFDVFTNVTSISGLFQNSQIMAFPENLLSNLTNATNASRMFYNSRSYITLGGTSMFPNLIRGLSNLTNCSEMFLSFDMSGAYNNRFNIPADFFPKNVNNFYRTFYNTDKFVGPTPNQPDNLELWERAGQEGYPATINGSLCYSGATRFDNYAEIPATWK